MISLAPFALSQPHTLKFIHTHTSAQMSMHTHTHLGQTCIYTYKPAHSHTRTHTNACTNHTLMRKQAHTHTHSQTHFTVKRTPRHAKGGSREGPGRRRFLATGTQPPTTWSAKRRLPRPACEWRRMNEKYLNDETVPAEWRASRAHRRTHPS